MALEVSVSQYLDFPLVMSLQLTCSSTVAMSACLYDKQ